MPPKYSGKKIIKAGEKLIDDDLIVNDPDAFYEAADILSYWRFKHETALEKAFTIIQTIAVKHDRNVIFAKRLKRLVSIVKKLKRFRKMKLKNMQDIGGCRIILSNEKRLRKTLRDLKKRPEFRFNGKLRIKDYIKAPKEDGYRGYHLIGKFLDAESQPKSIEIQLRTQIQHYWATALEIVDLFTGQALKSNLGNKDWKVFFQSVSDQFSIMEEIHLFEDISVEEQQKKYSQALLSQQDKFVSCEKTQKYSKSLSVIDKFEAFAASLQVIDNKLSELNDKEYGYVLLEIDIPASRVSTQFFPNGESKDAEQAYITNEKNAAGKKGIVVALVSTAAVGDIKEAYPNYFADSSKFLEHLILIQNIELPREKNIFEKMFSLKNLGDLR